MANNLKTIITLEKLQRFASNIGVKLDEKVTKEEGKGLSSNDFTSNEKEKLKSLENYTLPTASESVAGGIKVGAGLSITEDGILSATGGGVADSVEWDKVIGKPEDLATDSDISEAVRDLATKEEIKDVLKTGDVYSKEEVDAKVNAIYKFKGSVENLEALPKEGNEVGDVYYLQDANMNVVWTGEAWDYMGDVIDLTEYLRAEDLVEATDEQIDALFAN